jgi:phenylalanyl-tRNA synthetase beta chain
MEDKYVKAVLESTDGILALSAPPAPDESLIRSSLLPNMCKAVAANLRYYSEFAIFEAAQILQDKEYTTPYDSREALPLQRRNIAGAFVGESDNVTALFRKAKGVLEAMPRTVHMEGFEFAQTQKPFWADNVVWINIILGGSVVGNLALLSKKAALSCGIKNSAVMLFELDIDALKPLPSRSNTFAHLPEYPMTDYDVSLLFDTAVKWDEIIKVILSKKGGDSLLQNAEFVDEYKGKQVPQGQKSITIRLIIGSLTKTLTSAEIESCANAVVKRLKKQLGAEMRN